MDKKLEERIIGIEKKLELINSKLDWTARRNGDLGFYVGITEEIKHDSLEEDFFVFNGSDTEIPESLKETFWYDEKTNSYKYYSRACYSKMKRKSGEIPWETIRKNDIKPSLIYYKKVRKSKYRPTGCIITKIIQEGEKFFNYSNGTNLIETCQLEFVNGVPMQKIILYYAVLVTEKRPKYNKILQNRKEESIMKKSAYGAAYVEWEVISKERSYVSSKIISREGCWLYSLYDQNTIIGILRFVKGMEDYNIYDLNKNYIGKLSDL